jgi:hypothetical protein
MQREEAKMKGESSRARCVLIVAASMLGFGLFLAGCGTPEPSVEEPDFQATISTLEEQVHQLETQVSTMPESPLDEPDFRATIVALEEEVQELAAQGSATPEPPADEPDFRATISVLEEQIRQLEAQSLATAEAPQEVKTMSATLEIGGFGAEGWPNTLYIAASDVKVLGRFNKEAMEAISQAYTQTAYLEYALLYDGEENWRLYYAQPPAGIITPTRTQMHLLQAADVNQLLFASSPDYLVSEVIPISGTDEAGFSIPLQDGINLIKDELDDHVATGQVLSRQTAFLLLSDGVADQPQYTLISFGAVQPDGTLKPPLPGGYQDLVVYCNSVLRPPWWCRYFR